MAKSRKLGPDAPAAILEWQERESKWNAEASAWVRATLTDYFATDEGAYTARTASQIMHELLDTRPDLPSAWARLVVNGDTVSYNKRYAICRNALEWLARNKHVVMGTATNTRGNERSATYARPRSAADQWVVEVKAMNAGEAHAARNGILSWLALEGGEALRGSTVVVLTRKAEAYPGGEAPKSVTGGGKDDSRGETASEPGAAKHRNGPRTRKPHGHS
jgi:hypothetical protein